MRVGACIIKNPILDLSTRKIDYLVNLSASPFSICKLKSRLKIAINASKQLKAPIIYLNQVGANDDLIFDGNSFILNKKGEQIKQLNSFQEDFYCWDPSLKENFKIKKTTVSNIESVFDALVLGVKDYARKCGFKTALIGLSGGIDSALVAVIAVAALGSENVFCIAMPSQWNKKSSKVDAED